MRRPSKFSVIVSTIIAVVIGTGLLVGCAGSKIAEPFNDADVSGQNKGAAELINMPDGFSNVATKCDHGNRLYVIFHNDGAYGSVAVVANDPSCVGTK